MNPEQYHQEPEVGLPPPNFHYGGNFISSLHPDFQVQSPRKLLRPQPDQHHPTSYSIIPSNFSTYNFNTPMPISHCMNHWNSSPIQPQYVEEDNLYRYDLTGQDVLPTGFEGTPRTPYPQYGGALLNSNTMSSMSFQPSSYGLDYMRDNHGGLYDTIEGIDTRGLSRLIITRSPKMEFDTAGTEPFSLHDSMQSGMLLAESPGGGGQYTREMTATEVDELGGADEPYAKLIYRALMSAPGNAMVLQEIYQWFREKTNKGSSDSKGWMNSIRHNLSMNAAFKKTERKVSGDETKKSTEWVLEPFAIRDGVQSTTRYRKGTGIKKSVKSDALAPARQISGQGGGSQTHKLKRQRMRDDQFNSRDHRRPAITTPKSGMGGGHIPDSISAQVPQQQVPSLNPLAETMHSGSPYFLKHEHFDDDLPLYPSLEGVHGVYDGSSPLFVDDHGYPFHSMYINRC